MTYRKLTLLTVFMAGAISLMPVHAQEEEMPDDDISLFRLLVTDDSVSISEQQIIADHVGYDNQPRFIDNQSLYFTRMEDINADIWHWQVSDSNNNKVKKLTSTLESEYSPTPIPFKKDAFSTVRVEHDNTQRLWQVNSDGSFELLFNSIKPVGYHVWQNQNIAMFILGEPHRLEVTRFGQETTTIVDSSIGRTLSNVPGSEKVSYSVEKDGRHQLKLYDFASGASETLLMLPASSQDYAWLSANKLISSDGVNLLWTNINDAKWQMVKLPQGLLLKGLSRIAISPNGERIALVHHKI